MQLEISVPAFNPVPESFEEYRGWRLQFRAVMLDCKGVETAVVKKYVLSIADYTEPQLGRTDPDPVYEKLDGKLYSQLVKAMKGPKQSVHLLEVEVEVVFSQGRQLLLWLDRKHNFEIRKLASAAFRWLMRTKCGGYSALKDFLVKFKYSIFVVKAGGREPDEDMLFESLIFAIDGIDELQSTVSAFNAKHIEDRDYRVLMASLQVKIQDDKDIQEEKQLTTKGKAATALIVCEECGKSGHEKNRC
jgi:hypothetical protein